MSSRNWIKIALALALGIAAGLIYGLVVAPIKYTDATPDRLRADYRADYVLMVAEAYQAERDPALAARRLAMFGSQPPAQITAEAIEYARAHEFTAAELTLLQELQAAMLIYQPVDGATQ